MNEEIRRLTFPDCPRQCLHMENGRCEFADVCTAAYVDDETFHGIRGPIRIDKPSHYIVDVRPHGRWGVAYICSNCGKSVNTWLAECPICHAQMDK